MLLLNRIVVPTLTVFGLGFLIACGGGSNKSTPPPSGGFSNTNFSGTYTFSSSGSDTSGAPLEIAGSITACGCSAGTISAGTVDVVPDIGTGIVVTSSSSHYTVNADGTGTITLSLPTSPAVQYQFAFVLTDAAHGLISEFDKNGSGSGTIDLQPNAVTLASSSYAFSVSGTDTNGNFVASAGGFTLNSSGAISAGSQDFNYLNYNITGGYAGPWTVTGSVSAGTGTAPGSATLSSTFGSFTFDVYAIDATHVKLVESDGKAYLAGDAFSQPSTTIPSGTLAFTMAGAAGVGSSSETPVAVGGTVASDGASTLSSGLEDVNNAGNVDNGGTTPSNFNGTFVSTSGNTNGRFVVTLSGFFGGTNFVAYPSSGGVLMVEIDTGLGAGVTVGSAMVQNSPAGLVASQGYAMNLSGASTAGELDQIAQFNATSTSVSGQLYQNNLGASSPTSSSSFTGTITAGSNGNGELIFNNKTEGALYYGVDSATSLALGIDSGDVSLGMLQQQGSPTSTADVASRHLAMIKAAIHAKQAKKKKQQ